MGQVRSGAQETAGNRVDGTWKWDEVCNYPLILRLWGLRILMLNNSRALTAIRADRPTNFGVSYPINERANYSEESSAGSNCWEITAFCPRLAAHRPRSQEAAV